MTLEDRVIKFGFRLAYLAISREWGLVHEKLAPWLQARLNEEGVRNFFEDDYYQILSNAGIEMMHYPTVPYVSVHSTSLETLREMSSWKNLSRQIPSEITEENFRQWMLIQLQCSEEQIDEINLEYLTEFWLIVVEVNGEFKVGYWSHDVY
jgi:hypothetical protein